MQFALFGALLFLFFSSTIHGAEPPREDTLDPVVVTDTRLRDVEQPASRVPGKAIVVATDEIQKLGATTVQEVLQYQTGIVLYDGVGNEFQQTVDMRGFNAQPVTATSVFVDGVRVNEPDFNTINFDLIPIEDIERIEILPGTATVFGRNALAGVINITTKRGRRDRPHFGFNIGGGSYGRQRYSFNTDGPLPISNFDYYFGVTRELTNGYREEFGSRHAGATITRLLAKLGYRLGDNTDASVAYTRVLDNISQAGSLPASRLRVDRNDNLTPGDQSKDNLHQVALNLKQKLPAGFSVALNGFFRRNDIELFNRGLSSESKLNTETRSGGTTIQASHEGAILTMKNLLTLGFEYARNNFDSANSGIFLPSFTFRNMRSTKEDIAGIFLTDSFHLFDSLAIHGGLRYDWDRLDFTDEIDPTLSGIKTYHRVSPKAGLVYTPIKNLSVSFSYSEGVRIPTVDELFAQGPFGSNPDLKAMTSRNFELGAKAQLQDWLDASLALFYTPVRDEILFIVTDPILFFGRNENIARTLRRGIELSLKARYQKWLDVFLNYTAMKATFETDVLLFSGQVRKGDELPLVPRHRVGVGVNTYPIKGLIVSLFGNYVGSQFMQSDEPNQAKKVADYFVLNSRIAYQWKQWTGYVNFNNLTNRRYSTSGILVNEPFRVPAPGFNVFAGLSFRY
ncbi:MAG: TonB-dependent receptor [Deltaproteobacteria bacterium]|nr:TonB-dependent receptor [Deltaproteobacteria bacterium]